MRSWLRNLFAPRSPRTIRKAPARCRLTLEALEDRVLLNNTPPTILSARPVLPALIANEGTQATSSGTFDDAEGRATVTLTASLGTVTKNDAAGTWSWAYTPTDNTTGTIIVNITATDSGGLTATTAFTFHANNVAPTITAFADAEGVVGSPVTLRATTTDPAGPNDPLAYTWTVTRPDATIFNLFGAAPTFTPLDKGNYAVSLTVNDGDGGTATSTATVAVNNVPPTITSISVPASGVEGSPLALSAEASDSGGTNDPLGYVWTVTRPNGITVAILSGASASFTPPDNGDYGVSLTVRASDGGTATRTATVAVANVAPTITAFTVPASGDEGRPVTRWFGDGQRETLRGRGVSRGLLGTALTKRPGV